MRRILFAFALISSALAVQTVPQTAPRKQQPTAKKSSAVPPRKIPCKTPENASMCYWTRGRLSYYNGNPPYRLWKIGTTRVLGIYSGPSVWPPKDQQDQDNPEFPANIKRDFDELSNRILADFEICPLEPDHSGWMQHACIESATNIFLEK